MGGHRGIVVALALTAAASVLVAAPAPALMSTSQDIDKRAAPTKRLVLSPAVPTVGRAYRVAGRVPARTARTVVLQVAGETTWRSVRRTTSSRTGAFHVTWTSSRAQRLRVVAPAVARRSSRVAQPRWTSATTTVRPRAVVRPTASPTPTPSASPSPWTSPTPTPTPTVQTATLAGPPYVLERQQATFTLASSPAVLGRDAVLQRRHGEAWTDVATAETDASGATTFTVTSGAAGAGDAGAERYRAVLRADDDLAETSSDPVEVSLRQGLPRVDITTDDHQDVGAVDKSAYSHGSLVIGARGSGLPASTQQSRFRVRGNSTAWILVKLSYKIKLDTKASLVGLPKSKNWVLLANFYDRTLLRNNVAFEAARLAGLPWAPHLVNVELWQNGRYAGVYQLGETIESGAGRLDIETDAEGSDADAAEDGGYLLEADSWDDTDPRFTTAQGAQIYLHEPEFDSAEEATPYVERVRDDVQEFEDALYSDHFTDPTTGYRHYVDTGSFIDWYLVNELMKNVDANFNASCWLYRDNGGALSMGPVWDFDQSANSRNAAGLSDPTGWFLRKNWHPSWGWDVGSMFRGPEGHWLTRMFQDPWFVAQVAQRWQEVRAGLLTLPAYLESEAAALAPAAERNFVPVETGGAGMPIGWTFLEEDGIFYDSWAETVDELDDWLTARLAWLDDQLTPVP